MSEQPAELTVPTPAQWRERFLAATEQAQLREAEHVLEAYDAKARCELNDHEAALILIRDHRCPSIDQLVASRVDEAYAEGRNLGRAEGEHAIRQRLQVEVDRFEAMQRAHHDDDPQTEYAVAAHPPAPRYDPLPDPVVPTSG